MLNKILKTVFAVIGILSIATFIDLAVLHFTSNLNYNLIFIPAAAASLSGVVLSILNLKELKNIKKDIKQEREND